MPQLQHHGTDHLELRSFDTLHIPLHGNTIGPKPRNFQDAVVDNDHISTETYIAMYHEELRQGRTRSEERLELMLEWESLKHDFNTIGRVEPEVPCLTNCYSCSFVEFVEVYACEIRMTLTCKTPESFREKYSMFSDPKSGLGLGQGVADRCKIDYKDLSRKVKEIGEVLDSTRFPCCSWRFERDLQDVLADKQQLKSQLYQLLVAEDEEEAERQRQEREAEEMYQLDMYMQRLERFIRGVAVRLHAFFSSLFIFCKFAGFSDGGEPVCTTMPWNIKPALFVLWGVCWMFYPPQGRVDLAGDQHSIVADGLLEIDWSQWTNPDFFLNAGTNAFSEFTHAIDQPLEPSFNDFSSSLVVPITFGALDRPIGEVPGEVESQKGAHCTAMATVKDIPRQDSSALIIQTFPVEHLVSFDQQYMIDNTLDGPEPRAESSRAAQERQEPASTQPTSDGSQEQSVPVDPQDHISCDHAQCSGIRFSTMIDWTKHIDRLHDCQICTIAGCTQSFGSKGELYRHKQTRHNQILPNKLLKCPEQGCKYAGVPHFKRKDNLVEHLKRMHNLGQIEAKAAADSEAKIQFQARVCGHQSIPSVAIDASLPDGASASLFAPGDSPYSQNLPTQSVYGIMPGLSKKRCFNQALPEQSDLLSGQLVSFDGAPDDIETLRRKAAKLEADLQALQVEHTSVLANQEILKKENDRLKTNVDSLIAVLAANRKP